MEDQRIVDLIRTIRESFIGCEVVYTSGSCYQFFKILKKVFPESNAYYNSDHVITEINGRYYDITGEVKIDNHLNMDEHYPNSKVKENKFCIYGHAIECPTCEEIIAITNWPKNLYR